MKKFFIFLAIFCMATMTYAALVSVSQRPTGIAFVNEKLINGVDYQIYRSTGTPANTYIYNGAWYQLTNETLKQYWSTGQ